MLRCQRVAARSVTLAVRKALRSPAAVGVKCMRACAAVSFNCSVPVRSFHYRCSRWSAEPVSSSVSAVANLLSDGVAAPDDIEEADPIRTEHVHELEPQVLAPAAEGAPLQGIDLASDILPPVFTADELAALVKDFEAFREETKGKYPVAPTASAIPPLTPTPSDAPVSAAGGAAKIFPGVDGADAAQPRRPFLASWSVKEVCSWYLQVEAQLHPASEGDSGTSSAPSHPGVLSAAQRFVALLQKHRVDGARLLAFTSDPVLIPLISPQLLSRILYLRGLDTYSHMFQPPQHSGAGGLVDEPVDPSMAKLHAILHSTIKVYCTHLSPDFARPWSQQDQVESTSSAFVINGHQIAQAQTQTQQSGSSGGGSGSGAVHSKLIMGNAHGITHASNIRVRKHGDATKYKARILHVSHEADLMLLTVDSPAFWKGLEPLNFGNVPRLQDSVVVVGYPTGGDSICVTKGVVSRILVSNYVHSDESLLSCQVDAAINSGNSGGPVLQNGAVVGVAFQGVSGAQSVGFIIPVPVVLHFLTDLQLHGRYTGFPSFAGLSFQKLENEGLKRFFGLPEGQTGILLMDVAPMDGAAGVLKPNDVLTHIDGIPIADDGSIYFRAGERISCRYLPSSKFVGDTIRVRVIRDKKPMEVSFELKPRRSLVATHQYDTPPSYYILAGLVFTPLSRPYLTDTFGKTWIKRSPVDLTQLAFYGVPREPEQEVVLLSTILIDDVNVGYNASFHNIELVSVNGHKVNNLAQLVRIVEAEAHAGAPFLRFDFTLHRLIILETKEAMEATSRILQQNSIEFDRSANLRAQKQPQKGNDADAIPPGTGA